MKRILVFGLIAVLCSAGCSKKNAPAPAARPDDAVQLKLKELAGAGATDCGRLDVRAADQQLTGASNCATQAATSKKPFYVAYDMPGMVTGIAGGSDGKLFAVQLQGAGTGAQLASGPCPAELRVAHSGRLTCFIPGTMGLTPTASDPHSGIPMTQGTSPHGGTGIPRPFPTQPSPNNPKPKK